MKRIVSRKNIRSKSRINESKPCIVNHSHASIKNPARADQLQNTTSVRYKEPVQYVMPLYPWIAAPCRTKSDNISSHTIRFNDLNKRLRYAQSFYFLRAYFRDTRSLEPQIWRCSFVFLISRWEGGYCGTHFPNSWMYCAGLNSPNYWSVVTTFQNILGCLKKERNDYGKTH